MIEGVTDKLKTLKDRIDLHESYVAVFSSPEGQRVLRHIMKVGGVLSPSFVQGDPHGTSFKEGQRHLALSIAKMYCRDTTELIKLIEEGLTHEQT